MNRLETWFCGSGIWRWVTRKQLLPWLLRDAELGDQVLELGAGLGATTGELRKRAAHVTSLEYDHAFAAKLHERTDRVNGSVIQGDATALPFALVLGHHRFMTLLVKLCDHLGRLLALLRINPVKEPYVTE